MRSDTNTHTHTHTHPHIHTFTLPLPSPPCPPPCLSLLPLTDRFAYYLGDAASLCSPRNAGTRPDGLASEFSGVKCAVMDTSGNLVMHDTFARQPPSKAIFIGTVEPDLFAAMDSANYFTPTMCNDVQEGTVKNFVTVNKNAPAYKLLTTSDISGGSYVHEVAAVAGTNIYLIVTKTSMARPGNNAAVCSCSATNQAVGKCPCARALTFGTCSDEKSNIATQQNAACPAHVATKFSSTQAPPAGMKECMAFDCNNREYAQCIGTIGCKFCVLSDVGEVEIGEPYCTERTGQCSRVKGQSDRRPGLNGASGGRASVTTRLAFTVAVIAAAALLLPR